MNKYLKILISVVIISIVVFMIAFFYNKHVNREIINGDNDIISSNNVGALYLNSNRGTLDPEIRSTVNTWLTNYNIPTDIELESSTAYVDEYSQQRAVDVKIPKSNITLQIIFDVRGLSYIIDLKDYDSPKVYYGDIGSESGINKLLPKLNNGSVYKLVSISNNEAVVYSFDDLKEITLKLTD